MYKVLLVDDEPIVKIALRTIINWEELGFMICGTASDGEEAMALVEEMHPHIIITDLKMPTMNGLELIRALNQRNYRGKVIVASNFGDYELVREALLLGAVDYILKISIQPDALIEQLKNLAQQIEQEKVVHQAEAKRQNELQSSLKEIKATRLKSYLLYDDSDDLISSHMDVHYYFNEQPFVLFYFHIKDEEQQTQNSLAFLENVILDIFEQHSYMEWIPIDKQSIVALLSTKSLEQHNYTPSTLANKIQSLVKLYTSMQLNIVFSSQLHSYEEAKGQYQNCVEIEQLNFYSNVPIRSSEEITLTKQIHFAHYVELVHTLVPHMIMNSEAKIKDIIGLVIQDAERYHVPPAVVKNFIYQCLEYLPYSDQKLILSNEEAYGAYKKEIVHAVHKEQLLGLIMEALACFGVNNHVVSVKEQSITKKEINEVIQYVEQHYTDKLTLEMIAEHVNFSENYLCRVFREQMGMPLIHYINTVRLNKAAALILTGSVYMKEVATAVGFSDQFYFSRLFKKQFGVSPTDYRAYMQKTSIKG